jgi:hypothetical protein
MQTWLGKTLVAFGIFCLVLGLILCFSPKIPWLGKLPGDIRIQGERFSFYFPLVTCLILSVLLTILLNLFFRR